MFGLDKFYDKYKLWLWPVLVAIIIVAIMAVVITPQFAEYLKTKEEISRLTAQAEKLEQRAQLMEEIDQVATKEGLQVVLTVLPSDQEVPEALSSLQNLVDRSGVLLKSVSYASSKSKTNDKDSFQLSTGIIGPFSSIKDFLINVKGASRIFRVDSISARFQKDGTIVDADIPLSVFYNSAFVVPQVAVDQSVPELTEKEEKLLSQLSESMAQTAIAPVEEAPAGPLGKANPFE